MKSCLRKMSEKYSFFAYSYLETWRESYPGIIFYNLSGTYIDNNSTTEELRKYQLIYIYKQRNCLDFEISTFRTYGLTQKNQKKIQSLHRKL